eukprot:358937-Chlamydomonas_euryale.AAC.19
MLRLLVRWDGKCIELTASQINGAARNAVMPGARVGSAATQGWECQACRAWVACWLSSDTVLEAPDLPGLGRSRTAGRLGERTCCSQQ